jgi:hypothetical protein
MKKLFALIMIAGMFNIVACGPSAEEKAKAEADAKAQADSVMNATQQAPTEVVAADTVTVAPDSAVAR